MTRNCSEVDEVGWIKDAGAAKSAGSHKAIEALHESAHTRIGLLPFSASALYGSDAYGDTLFDGEEKAQFISHCIHSTCN